MGKTLGNLLREAREAYELNYIENSEYDPDWRVKCDEQVAQAVRSKVIEEAIEAIKYEAQFFDVNGKTAANRLATVLQRLMEESHDTT